MRLSLYICITLIYSGIHNVTITVPKIKFKLYPNPTLADKLVLGLPWYGYRYECLGAATDQDDTCNIAQVPFRLLHYLYQ